MYNFVQKYFAQIVHFCIDNNRIKATVQKPKEIDKLILTKNYGN